MKISDRARALLAGLAAAAFVAVWVVVAPGNASQLVVPTAERVVSESARTCVLDLASQCTVTTNFGEVPKSITIQEYGPGQAATIVSKSANSYRLRWLWHNGTGWTTRPTIKFDATYTFPALPTATTPPPTSPPVSTPPATTPPPTSPTVNPAACTDPVYTTNNAESNGAGGFSNGGFEVHNNVWNPQSGWSQQLNACTYKSWYVLANQPGTGSDDSVKSYPGIQKYPLNISMNALGNITSSFNVAPPAGLVGGVMPGHGAPAGPQWNAAYDLWLRSPSGAEWNTEVMIWNNWAANWRYWYDTYNGHETTIDGVAYYAYSNVQTGQPRPSKPAMWFVRKNVTNAGTIDVDNVLKYAMTRGWILSTQSINAIEYGFEIFYTGGTRRFDLLDYSLTTS